MDKCGSAAVQGFEGTRSGVAPPSGVELPERWVLKRRSGFRSITEHCLGPEFVCAKTRQRLSLRSAESWTQFSFSQESRLWKKIAAAW